MAQLQVGDSVWVPHPEDAWLASTITSKTSKDTTVKTYDGRELKVSKKDFDLLEKCGRHLNLDVDNLVDLEELSEGAILHHVRKRYFSQKIYTHVGTILVATNPFEFLNIYNKEDMISANRQALQTPFPHVFTTGATAFHNLRNTGVNQSVLISGESGAGKTETTKKVLSFLAAMAPSKSSGVDKSGQKEIGIEDKILQSNPLLESLGNAKTLRNDNSSRFGKWMSVGFDDSFCIKGCSIINYLLEKSRVTRQTKGERNYHIFYFMLSGANSEMKKDLFLKGMKWYYICVVSKYTIYILILIIFYFFYLISFFPLFVCSFFLSTLN
jgi:myosin heavy subunit